MEVCFYMQNKKTNFFSSFIILFFISFSHFPYVLRNKNGKVYSMNSDKLDSIKLRIFVRKFLFFFFSLKQIKNNKKLEKCVEKKPHLAQR